MSLRIETLGFCVSVFLIAALLLDSSGPLAIGSEPVPTTPAEAAAPRMPAPATTVLLPGSVRPPSTSPPWPGERAANDASSLTPARPVAAPLGAVPSGPPRPGVAAPAMRLVSWPTGGANLHPTMACVDSLKVLIAQVSVVKPVTVVEKETHEEVQPDGRKLPVTRSTVQIRYTHEFEEEAISCAFDVYKMDGTKLSMEAVQKEMKADRVVVFVSSVEELAEALSPLGTRLYRDDVLIVALRAAGRELPAKRSASPPPAGPHLLPTTSPSVNVAPPS